MATRPGTPTSILTQGLAGENGPGDPASILTRGALQQIEAASLPDPADVRAGVDRGDGVLGTMDIPEESDVRAGVYYDGLDRIGTLPVMEASGQASARVVVAGESGLAVVDATVVDFDRAMVVDVRHGAAFPGEGFAFAATLRGGVGARAFAGGTDGYLYKTHVEDASGLGTPTAKVRWNLTGDSTASVLAISAEQEGAFWPIGYLAGLAVWVRYAATGAFAYGVCASNTKDTLTLEAALAEAPEAGDWLWVAPMVCGALFAEDRYQYPATPMYLRANVASGADQDFTLGVYSADDPALTANLSVAPDATQRFTVRDLQRGGGRVGIRARASRAQLCSLSFTPAGNGKLTLNTLGLEVSVSPREALRHG